MSRVLFLLLFIPIIFLREVEAQKYTLENCITLAIENNLSLKVARNTEQQQILQWQQSKRANIPEVSAGFNYNYIFGTAFDNVTYQRVQRTTVNSFPSLDVNTCLFEGFAKVYRNKYYSNLAKKADEDVDVKQQEVILEVIRLYSSILISERRVELQQKRVEELSQLYSNINVLVEKGEKSGVDLAQVQSQLENEKIALIKAKNENQITKLELGYYVNDTLLIESDFFPLKPELDDFDTSFQIDGKKTASFQSQFYNAEAARYQSKLSLSEFYPKVYLNASVASSYSSNGILDFSTGQVIYPSYGKQLNLNGYQFVGVSVQIPIFSGLKRYTQWQGAKLAKTSQELQTGVILNNMQLEIKRLKSDILSIIKVIEMYKQQFISSELAYKMTVKNYEMGESSFYDLLTSMNAMNQTQLDLLKSEYELCLLAKKKKILMGVLFK